MSGGPCFPLLLVAAALLSLADAFSLLRPPLSLRRASQVPCHPGHPTPLSLSHFGMGHITRGIPEWRRPPPGAPAVVRLRPSAPLRAARPAPPPRDRGSEAGSQDVGRRRWFVHRRRRVCLGQSRCPIPAPALRSSWERHAVRAPPSSDGVYPRVFMVPTSDDDGRRARVGLCSQPRS